MLKDFVIANHEHFAQKKNILQTLKDHDPGLDSAESFKKEQINSESPCFSLV